MRLALAWGLAAALALGRPARRPRRASGFRHAGGRDGGVRRRRRQPRRGALKALLGNNFRELIPPVGDECATRFLAAWAEAHAIEPSDAKTATSPSARRLDAADPAREVGKGWQFDTVAGVDEMRIRRSAATSSP
jgi:hypothetical protein